MRLTHHPVAHSAPSRDWWVLPRRREEGGFVMSLFALLLVPLLLMVGFAVDVGYWYNRASDIQKAADAAALAGVVFLPDENRARTVAREVAGKNGYAHGVDGVTVDVVPSATTEQRLKVTIRDPRVGSFFYESFTRRKIPITRVAYAQYVAPVPMGSPRNYIGTGPLVTADPDGMYMAVSSYCATKANGDRHQTPHPASGTATSTSNCSAAPTNLDYRSGGYEYYIDAVEGRTSDIEVRLYDPYFRTSNYEWDDTANTTCTTVTGNWTETRTSGNPQTGTLTLPSGRRFQYQRRTRASTAVNFAAWPNYSATTGTETTTGASLAWSRTVQYRYRELTQSCTTPRITETPIDLAHTSTSSNETYRFDLYAADSTPFDDSDNPVVCSMTFSGAGTYDSDQYLGSRKWVTMRQSNASSTPCRISTGGPSGRYILRVRNHGSSAVNTNQSNSYGIVARYVNASGDGLCDGRTDTSCPRIYGKGSISVFANITGGIASFYLAEIEPMHAGKRLKLELWDPGEGGSLIEIMRPTGTNSWTPARFNYEAVGTSYSGTNVASIDVTNSKFNAQLLEIEVPLTGYSPPASNNWWKIRYTFNDSSNPNPTDRTTWSAAIVGDPVHLVEEN